MLRQIIAMECVNVWEYPDKELEIVRVDADNHPELFWGLQVSKPPHCAPDFSPVRSQGTTIGCQKWQ